MRWGRPSRPAASATLPGLQQLADARARDHFPALQRKSDRDDFEAVRPSVLAKVGRSARPTVPEAEVLTHKDGPRPQMVRQHRAAERFRRQQGELLVERHHHEFVHAEILEQLLLAAPGRQHRRGRPAVKDSVGVRKEGHRSGRGPAVSRGSYRPPQDLLVAAMHSVEHADGDDSAGRRWVCDLRKRVVGPQLLTPPRGTRPAAAPARPSPGIRPAVVRRHARGNARHGPFRSSLPFAARRASVIAQLTTWDERQSLVEAEHAPAPFVVTPRGKLGRARVRRPPRTSPRGSGATPRRDRRTQARPRYPWRAVRA